MNVAGSFNSTALIWAAMKDDLEIVNALIQAGAEVNKPGYNGRTALYEASHCGSLKCVMLLLSAGAIV